MGSLEERNAKALEHRATSFRGIEPTLLLIHVRKTVETLTSFLHIILMQVNVQTCTGRLELCSVWRKKNLHENINLCKKSMSDVHISCAKFLGQVSRTSFLKVCHGY